MAKLQIIKKIGELKRANHLTRREALDQLETMVSEEKDPAGICYAWEGEQSPRNIYIISDQLMNMLRQNYGVTWVPEGHFCDDHYIWVKPGTGEQVNLTNRNGLLIDSAIDEIDTFYGYNQLDSQRVTLGQFRPSQLIRAHKMLAPCYWAVHNSEKSDALPPLTGSVLHAANSPQQLESAPMCEECGGYNNYHHPDCERIQPNPAD